MIAKPRTMTEAIIMRKRQEREAFAARVRGEHSDQKVFRRYVLAELRLAYRRAKLHMEAITEAARMVHAGVDPELALSSIGDALDYVIPAWPEGTHDDTAEACESESERELHVRGRLPEIHGDGKPNGNGAAGGTVPEQS